MSLSDNKINHKKDVLDKTAVFIKDKLSKDSSGHDWWHIYRVWKLAKKIAEQEKADVFIVQLGALLHDIADYKLYGGDEEIGPAKAREWLKKINLETKEINHVCQIIKDISFQGAKVKTKLKTIEAKIVQDADRLDAIGAIGITRTFAFGGFKGRTIYDPDIKPRLHNSFDEYKNNTSPTINHFYEKLLLLHGLMNTSYAKKVAKDRTRFMKQFLKEFYLEWEGKV